MERLQACSPHARMVIFVATHQEQHVFQALQHGAIGYLTRDVEPDALIHAIRCAARNDLCIPATLASSIVAHLRTLWLAQEPPHGIHPARISRTEAYHLQKRSLPAGPPRRI